VFPVEERRVPQSDCTGELASPTQPFPLAPPPLAAQKISAEDAWGPTQQDRDACLAWMKNPSQRRLFNAAKPSGHPRHARKLGRNDVERLRLRSQHSLLIVNTNNLVAKIKLIPAQIFAARCSRGRTANILPKPCTLRLVSSLLSRRRACRALRPMGLLSAVDMNEGKIRWQLPLGSMQDFGGKQPPILPGSISLGVPIVTAGGLVFIAATFDPFLRAFDIETGKELWKAQLPASGHATPMTYRLAHQVSSSSSSRLAVIPKSAKSR